MDLKEIMSVSGQGGLFKFISQARNGIIVESFADQKRSFVSASTKISTLEDIAVYTDEEEVPLKDVFKAIQAKESEITVPDARDSSDALKGFMEKILPEYDRDRVYVSDIKKIVNWYSILKEQDLLHFEDAAGKENGNDEGEPEDKEKAEAADKVKNEAGAKKEAKAGKKGQSAADKSKKK